MSFKIIFFTIFFFILAIIQARFLTYFSIWGSNLNLVFISFFVYIFFNNKRSSVQYIVNQNIYFALLIGFLLDCFSALPFGVNVISYLIIGFFIKKMQYNLAEKSDNLPISYFVLLFIITFIFNELFLALSFYIFNDIYFVNLNWFLLISFLYNLIIACFIFYVFKKLQIKK